MENELRQLHDQLRTSQDKYTYFLLAITASAVAFSLQITKLSVFSYSLIPLAIAAICWGLSFFFGCKNIQYINSTLYANHEYLTIKSGTHKEVGAHPQYIQAACEGITAAMESNSNVANRYSKWQFRLAIYGGIFFVVWHVVEMGIRTVK